MYINFEKLLSSGLDPSDLAFLLAIRQKESIVMDSIPKECIDRYITDNFIEIMKSGSMRLTQKGSSFITVIETPVITEVVNDTLKEMMTLYKVNEKEIGVSNLEAQDRLAWFIGNTNFKKETIVNMTRKYIEDSGDYTMSLCNFIWKPASVAFSVHKSLKNSKLFDMISNEYGFNTDLFFKERKNREEEWLFAVSRLPNPPVKANSDYLFTMDVKKEKERLNNIKTYLFNMIKKWKK